MNRTKFGNDRSREYKVTEGRISACRLQHRSTTVLHVIELATFHMVAPLSLH